MLCRAAATQRGGGATEPAEGSKRACHRHRRGQETLRGSTYACLDLLECLLGACVCCIVRVTLKRLIGPLAHLGLLFNSTFQFFFFSLSSSIPTPHSGAVLTAPRAQAPSTKYLSALLRFSFASVRCVSVALRCAKVHIVVVLACCISNHPTLYIYTSSCFHIILLCCVHLKSCR